MNIKNLTDKTTIYLDPRVKKFIQYKAVSEGRSVSVIINEDIEDMLEDLEDIKEINQRRTEPSVAFEKILQDLEITQSNVSMWYISVREVRNSIARDLLTMTTTY